MATISNTPRPGYVFDVTDNVWYPIGTGSHNHSEIATTIVDAKGDLIAATGADAVSRLAVGANTYILTADSSEAVGMKWAAPAGSDYKLINTTTFSAVASQSVNSVFTSTYTNYKLIFNISSGTADSITFVLRAAGTDTTANYASARMGWNGSVQFNGNNNTGTDDWYIGFDASASQDNAGDMTLFKPQAATQTSFISFGKTGTLAPQMTAGTQTDSTQFDGFTLSIITGTFSGTVSTYGLAK